MQALRHTSYIRDFDVEIAQAAAVANPIVDVVRDGVVLDVRPVVSADRRFITMELRPTVMALQFPIPTFTTTLGAGQPVSIQLPDVTLQSVRTTVTMPDGGSILLGGMKLAERQNIVSGVPLLKDLPILSFLFSRKGTFTLNRKIIILIKARIVISEEFEPKLIPDDFDTLLTNR
jgi:type II secretory pathway component GspD/PulD (secretin)